MGSFEQIISGLTRPVVRLFDLSDPFSLASLCGAAALAAAYVPPTRRLGRGARFAEISRALSPPGVLTHPSTALDAKLYLANSFLLVIGLGAWIIGGDAWSRWTSALLETILGPPEPTGMAPWLARSLATLTGVVAFDFGYYIAHWLAHRSPVLWRFHRLHHAAPVMTPLTGGREHPVDTLLFGNAIGFCVGVSGALLGHAIGAGADPYLLHKTNGLLVAYYFTLQHLRHSHVWLPFTGPIGRILQSPAHHQLHHSIDPAHHGRNLGFSLAAFDAVFGTLLVPQARQSVVFGLADEPAGMSVEEFYFRPFEPSRSAQERQ